MNTQEIIDLEHDNVLQVYGRPAFVLERGEGCTLYDSGGQRLSGLRGRHRRQCAGL